MTNSSDALRRVRSAIRLPGADDLTTRVRWLFLALLTLVVSTTVVGTIASPFPLPSKPGAVLAFLAWWSWGLYRYRRPHAHVATDLVPLLAMATVGLATGSTFLLFGAAFVSLYFRTMFGSRREAIMNALGYFAVYVFVWVLTPASGPVDPIGLGIMLVAFVGIGAVMHALGAAARDHHQLVHRERILTDLSGGLLTATSPEGVHRIAVDGALVLSGDASETTPSATLWIGRDELRRVASAGPERADHQRVLLESAPPDVRSRFAQGVPFLLDHRAVTEVQDAFAQRDLFQELLAVPIVRGGEPAGVLVVVSPGELPRGVVPLMGRFGNEIAMALDRAELLEDLRRANLQLREANAAKDEFVSTVSHELRTPLTSIGGFAQTLRHHWRNLSDAQCDQYLGVIERQSQNQQRMVEDLLTTSRAMAGRLPVAPTVVEVGAALRDVLDVVPVDPGLVGVDCPDGLNVVVDPHHLQQTLVNLLTNAHKYGKAPYEIHADRDGDEAVVTVSDHGTGVPPEFRHRLFEAFAQAEAGDTRTSRGVGLGLSIVQRLMEANSGSINYRESGPTPGASFEFRLPLASRAQSASSGGAGQRELSLTQGPIPGGDG